MGAVAEASFDAALAAMAEFEDIELDAAIVALASEAAAVFSVEAGLLQAATERAARAAPTIRMERSVPEVIFLVPSGRRLQRRVATLGGNMTSSRSSARASSRARDHFSSRRSAQRSAGIAPRASSSSRKLGWAPDGTLPRPISTEICAALPCRWATSTDWMIR